MLSQLIKAQRAALFFIGLVVCLPLLSLVILGLVQLWQNQWLIHLSIVWLIVTLLGFALYQLWPEQKIADSEPAQPDAFDVDATGSHDQLNKSLPLRLEARADWSSSDILVWQHSVADIETLIESKPGWEKLPELCLEVLARTSHYYSLGSGLDSGLGSAQAKTPDTSSNGANSTGSGNDSTYHFTAPEMLMVLCVTADRYRQLLLRHIPFADSIKISFLLSIYEKQGRIRRGASWLNTARRTVRLINPMTAAIAELRDQFTNRIFAHLSDRVQHDLKRLLLQELVQVAMDLYSGRLKSSGEELASFRSSSMYQDEQHLFQAAEPLRVVIVGQVSAGKSSLVNALVQNLEAETDTLPTTEKTTVHRLSWQTDEASGLTLHLVDTVGISEKTDAPDALLDLASNADILVWTAKATQAARANDAHLYQRFDAVFDTHTPRRKPPILLALTHVDQLSPKAIWQPPYDLTSDDPKALNMMRAMDSCLKQIGLPHDTVAVPVCLADENKLYNIEALSAEIMALQATAIQVQFNRRRLELNQSGTSWQQRWRQVQRLGRASGKVLVRSLGK